MSSSNPLLTDQYVLRGAALPTAAQMTSVVLATIALLARNPHFAAIDEITVMLVRTAAGVARLRAQVRDGRSQPLVAPIEITVNRTGAVGAIIGGTGTLNLTLTGTDATRFVVTPDADGFIDFQVTFGAPGTYAYFIRLPYVALPVASIAAIA